MSQKISAIKGMEDWVDPKRVTVLQRLEAAARKLFTAAGLQEIRTPIVEEAALFERSVGESSEIVEKEMYCLVDRNGKKLALRPEGTASVVRAFVEHFTSHQILEAKFFYFGPMFRYERPQKGRYRQFHQIGAEIFGLDHPRVDAELIALVHQLAKAVGLEDLSLHLNSLGSAACRKNYLKDLGDFLASIALNLCEDCQRRRHQNPLRVLDCKNPSCIKLLEPAPNILDSLSEDSKSHFEQVQQGLKDLGIPFQVRPRMVRGLDYYEKTVFEFVSQGLGAQNSIAGGGRYNGLVPELGGPQVPAVGFALGVERWVELLQDKPLAQMPGKVWLIPLDDVSEREFFCQQAALREFCIVETAFGDGSLKNKLKRAARAGADWVVLSGSQEREQGKVVVRNMREGAQEEVPVEKWILELRQKVSSVPDLKI